MATARNRKDCLDLGSWLRRIPQLTSRRSEFISHKEWLGSPGTLTVSVMNASGDEFDFSLISSQPRSLNDVALDLIQGSLDARVTRLGGTTLLVSDHVQ